MTLVNLSLGLCFEPSQGLASSLSVVSSSPLSCHARSEDDEESENIDMKGDFQRLPALGPYYGEDWFVRRKGEGAFNPLVNRKPAQAARARQEPLPANLETYAAALMRDQIDDNIVLEWSPFQVEDIEIGAWITEMIRDHKVTKHTANALLLYPSLKGHCPRCTQIHDKGHRKFSAETCVVLNAGGPLEGFLPCKYVYCKLLPIHARVYCPKINLRCFSCLHRGHAEEDNVCKAVEANLTIFEETANLGWVTKNRFRVKGAA
jgi:hypothetical protein